MTRRVLTFPATMREALFGTPGPRYGPRAAERVAPTIPAPIGGWGVPAVEEETGALTFSIPAASMTPELEAYITRPSSAATTQTPDGYRAARAVRMSGGGR
jgi:hypothetical protein